MDIPAGVSEAIARGREDIPFFLAYFFDLYVHPGQEKWLTNSVRKINCLVPANRYGKSVVTAGKHLHHNFYKYGAGWEAFVTRGGKGMSSERWKEAPYETINVSISADQADIVGREAVQLCNRPRFKPWVKGIYSTPFPHIEFVNGAAMHCRSTSDKGKYIDGHRYAYMSYDEAGWEPDLDWLLGTVLLVRLADWGGLLDIIGTPKGRGDLYRLFMRGINGDPGVYSQSGSIYENPYVSEEEKAALSKALRAINPKLERQAMHGDFIEADGLVFTYDQIHGNMVRPEEYPVEMEQVAHGVEYRIAGRPPDMLRKYRVAFDLARKSDRTVGTVLDVTEKPYVLDRLLVLTQAPWEYQYEAIRRYGSLYGDTPLIDSTGLGDVVDSELTTRGIPHECFDFNDGRGLKKERLITNLQNGLDYARPDPGDPELAEREWGLLRSGLVTPLLDELSVYEFSDRKLSTDCVMSFAMAFWKAHKLVALPEVQRISMRGRGGRRRR